MLLLALPHDAVVYPSARGPFPESRVFCKTAHFHQSVFMKHNIAVHLSVSTGTFALQFRGHSLAWLQSPAPFSRCKNFSTSHVLFFSFKKRKRVEEKGTSGLYSTKMHLSSGIDQGKGEANLAKIFQDLN